MSVLLRQFFLDDGTEYIFRWSTLQPCRLLISEPGLISYFIIDYKDCPTIRWEYMSKAYDPSVVEKANSFVKEIQ